MRHRVKRCKIRKQTVTNYKMQHINMKSNNTSISSPPLNLFHIQQICQAKEHSQKIHEVCVVHLFQAWAQRF